jgi:hypothetical protein
MVRMATSPVWRLQPQTTPPINPQPPLQRPVQVRGVRRVMHRARRSTLDPSCNTLPAPGVPPCRTRTRTGGTTYPQCSPHSCGRRAAGWQGERGGVGHSLSIPADKMCHNGLDCVPVVVMKHCLQWLWSLHLPNCNTCGCLSMQHVLHAG